MKILGLVSVNILPGENHSAYAKRIINMYNELSRWHSIDILNVVPPRCARDTLHLNTNLTVRKISLPYTTLFHYLSRYRMLPWVYVVKLHEFFSVFCSRYIQKEYDLLQVDSLSLYGLVRKRMAGKRCVYASHNVELDWHRPLIERCLFSSSALRYLENLEGELCRRAALVTTMSEQDRLRFIQLYHIAPSRVVYFPMGYSSVQQPVQQDQPVGPREDIRRKYSIPIGNTVVLFCGSDFYANQEALDVLAQEIIPYLEDNITVLLVGKIGNYYRKVYPQGLPKTISLGFIENIREIYSISDLAVNPVLSGSGANVKTIDYLASGLELLSTPFGMRGYDDMVDQAHICQVHEMAKQINRFTERSVEKRNTGKIARYKWSEIGARANREYEQLFEKPHRVMDV